MPLRDRLLDALEAAEADAAQERQEIHDSLQGVPEEQAQRMWEEESSAMLTHLEDEVSVAKTNLLLHDARHYHLPTPDWSDHSSWYTSRLSSRRYLSPEAHRDIQRALLEESRNVESARIATMSARVAFLGLGVAALSLLVAALSLWKDVPIGAFLIDLVKTFKG